MGTLALSVVRFDSYSSGCSPFRIWQGDLKHAVFEFCFYHVTIDPFGDRDPSFELAVRGFPIAAIIFFHFIGSLPFTLNDQGVFFYRDLDVFGLYSRKVQSNQVFPVL